MSATDDIPDPAITNVSVPDSVSTSESINITVEGTNSGGTGGHFSTITVSFPDLDESDDSSQLQVTDASDHAYHETAVRGDTVYDANGEEMTAEYALVEAGSDGQSFWESGESRQLSVEFLPESTGTFEIYVRVTLPDDDDQSSKYNAPSSSGYSDQQGFYVERYEVDVQEEADIQATIQSMDVDSGTYGNGEAVDTQAQVENTGNREHTFFIGYSVWGPNDDDYDNGDTTGRQVSLAPGEDQWLSLSWEVESTAPEGSYDVQVSTWEESDRNNLQTRLDDKWEYDAFYLQRQSVNAEITGFDPASGTYSSGEIATTTVEVENTGSTDHEFYVGYTVFGPSGEAYNNNDSTGQAVSISPDQAQAVDLDWHVPSDAPAGRYDIEVAVWKESDPNGLETELDQVEASESFAIESEETAVAAEIVDYYVNSGEYVPGEEVEAAVAVENPTDTTRTFFVGFTAVGPEGGRYNNDWESGKIQTVPANDDVVVELTWHVQSTAPNGAYDGEFTVWKETDRDSLQTELAQATAEDAFSVEQTAADGELGSVTTESGPYTEGQVVPTTVEVTNTGEAEHTFYLGYTPVGPDGEKYDNNGTSGQRVTLPPQEETDVELEWQVTRAAPAGEYEVDVTLWAESDPEELATELDSARQSNAFEVRETLAAATIEGISIGEGPFAGGEVVEPDVEVRNSGETDHTYFVEFEVLDETGEPVTRRHEGTRLTVESGITESATIEWTVPTDLPSRTYDIAVTIWSERDRENLETELAERTRGSALNIDNPQVTITEVLTQPEDGIVESLESTPSVKARLHNSGDEETSISIEHRIRNPSGDLVVSDTGTVTLRSDGTRTVGFQWPLSRDQELERGSYDYVVTLYSDDGESILKRTYSDVFSLDIGTLGRTSFYVEVLEASGEQVEEATVSMEAVNRGATYSRQLANGSVEFEDIEAGVYNITVEHGSAYLEEEFKAVVAQELPGTATVLPALEIISGVVLDDTGQQQVPGATVRVDGIEQTTTDDLGMFRTQQRVPDGTYNLTVDSPDGSTVRTDATVDSTRHLNIQTNQPLVGEEYRGMSPDLDLVAEENQLVTVLARYIQNKDDEDIILNHYSDMVHGVVKGLVASIVDTFNGVKEAVLAVLSLDIADVLVALIKYIAVLIETRGGIVWRIITAMLTSIPEGLEDIYEKQQDQNPYELPNPRTYSFMGGWFLGYFGFTLVLGWAGRATVSASRAVFEATDTFTDALDSASSAIRWMDEDEVFLPRDLYLLTKSYPVNGVRSKLKGGFGLVKAARNAPTPEVFNQILSARYLALHRNWGRMDDSSDFASDPLDGLRDKATSDLTEKDIVNMAGKLAESAVAWKMLDGIQRFPKIDKILSRFDPEEVSLDDTVLVTSWDYDGSDLDAEFDLLEVELRQLNRGEAPVPVVTRVWEVTSRTLESKRVSKRENIRKILQRTADPDEKTPEHSGISGNAFARGDGEPPVAITSWQDAVGISKGQMNSLTEHIHRYREELDFLFRPENTND